MAGDQLEIKGNEGSAQLRLSIDGDEFTVTLIDDGLTAEARGWFNTEMEEPDQLGRFFADLATSWEGWEGEKTWRALEAPFYLSAIHDRLGHVTVTARIQEGWIPPSWSAETSLVLDAGSLDELAARVNRFLIRS